MKRFIAVCLAFIIAPTFSAAQECSPETDANAAILTSQFNDLDNKRRRANARLESQVFQIAELGETARAAISAAPTMPVLPETYFDAAGEIAWTCDADGAPMPSVAAYGEALLTYEAALDAIDTELRARGTEIADALNAQEADAQLADADMGDAAADDANADDDNATDEGDIADGADTDVAAIDPEMDDPAAAPQDEGTAPADDTAQDVDVAQQDEAEPLADPDNPNLFRRVLSLPNTRLHAATDPESASELLPTFSVMYVFEEASQNGVEWFRVATSLREGDQGWVSQENTLDWSTMLVMEFTKPGTRKEVLFFENDQSLSDIVNDFAYATEATALYDRISVERDRLAAEPGTAPQWDQRLVAIEPLPSVSAVENPYLLPILDWREELFDGTVETTLLQVAALPADAQSIQENDRANPGVNLNQAAMNDGVFRVGVVFVVDTTVSMRPFIERTYQTIETFYNSFNEMETSSFVSFGLVGFRDSIDFNSELEYTTHNFQPLDPEADARSVLTNMRQMTESGVPTIGFKEDSFAGVLDAVGQNDWTPYDARIIVLITDASARTGVDELAKYTNYTAQSVASYAANERIAIIPVHLLTPTNQRNGDAETAAEQYRTMASLTGDEGNDKYIALDATDEDSFLAGLTEATRAIAGAVLTIASGEVVNVDLEEIPSEPTLASAIVSEIFSAQLESLSVTADGSAPNFLAGWAADKDLTDPDLNALEVKVFLTRNQLSTLDSRLSDILDAFRSGGDDPTAFFENLQNLAAQTSTDPDMVGGGMDDRAAVQAIMPAFLSNLPYKSDILNLDREFWNDISVAQRSEFIERLGGKRQQYEDLYANTEIWQSFGSQDTSLQVTAVPLRALP